MYDKEQLNCSGRWTIVGQICLATFIIIVVIKAIFEEQCASKGPIYLDSSYESFFWIPFSPLQRNGPETNSSSIEELRTNLLVYFPSFKCLRYGCKESVAVDASSPSHQIWKQSFVWAPALLEI